MKKTVYRVARTRDELEKAYKLVYYEYKCRGYIPKFFKSKLRLSIYNAVPSTVTFIAKQGDEVVATVSLIPDSSMGLLMDKLYKKETDGLRSQHRGVAEVGQFAVSAKLFPADWYSMFNFKKLIFLFKLFKLVLDYALHVGKINDLCIVFNPRHQYLYKFLKFEYLGPLKRYGSFNSPAIAMRQDLDTASKRVSGALYKIFFREKIDPKQLEGKYMWTSDDVEYFFMKKSDILGQFDSSQLAYLRSCYPKGSIEKMVKELKKAGSNGKNIKSITKNHVKRNSSV